MSLASNSNESNKITICMYYVNLYYINFIFQPRRGSFVITLVEEGGGVNLPAKKGKKGKYYYIYY